MIKPPFMRSPYNYDLDEASNSTAYVETMPSLTVQSQTEDTDLNVIMARFGITGRMPDNPRIPQYGDFSEITDYRSALEAVRTANEGFMEIPAPVRARFENNPQLLLEFCSNSANMDEAKKLGLLKENFNGTSMGNPGPSSEARNNQGGGGSPPQGGTAGSAPAAGNPVPAKP